MSKMLWGLLSCLCASLCALCMCFCNKSYVMTANAALSGGKFLTQEETLNMFGRQITGRYYNGTEYVDTIFYYNTADGIGEIYADYDYSGDIVSRGIQGLIYTASNISVNTNPQYITFDLKPEISILNTSQIHTVIGLSGGGSISNTVYSPPRWEWFINGQQTIYQAQGGAGLSYPQYWPSFQGFGQYYYSFVRADYTSNSPISGYSLRVSFYGNSVSGGNYLLFIAFPYVSSNATGQNGTLPAETTTINPTYTVIVDNAGVESRLDDVVSAVDNLGDIIQQTPDYDFGSEDDTIMDTPSEVDEEAIEDAMSVADTILDDIPSIVATGAFWMECAKALVNDESFIIIVPVCILLSFIVYLWWKK